MTRRVSAFALLIALLLAALAPTTVSAAPPRPNSMAAAGDSITRAFNLCFFPFTDCPARSWSTGNNSTVDSHARRLKITSSAFNDAVSGARMSDFPSQASIIAGRNVDYVTVLMGGNDVCRDTESDMTDPALYEAQFRAGMDRIATDPSPPLVFVVSVPNVKTLWEILKDNSSARSAWNSYNICQSLLADPLSTDQADVDRRERVRQRNMQLNQRLRVACASYAFCRFDGEGAFGTAFVPSDVSTRDYFHPSTDGQKKLAAVSFDLGFWGTKGVNGAPVPSFGAPSCTGLTCSFSGAATDPENHLIGGWSWQFGDGGTSASRQATHTFAASGTYNVTLYAIDALGATWSVTQPIAVKADGEPAPNSPPTASFTHSCTDLVCSFDASASSDSDGSITGYVWTFGDGATATGVGASHTYAKGDTYTVELTVTDDDNATGSASATVTVTAASTATTMHVADLEGSGATVNRNFWRATVTITVVDSTGAPVSGATVDGSFSGSAKSCTTAAGACTVTSDNLRQNVDSVEYSVTTITHTTLLYNDTANVESSILIARPS